MSKRRKTKAQKLQTAERRQRQLTSLIKTSVKGKMTATTQVAENGAAQVEHTFDPRPQLAQSMRLLGILVLLQLGIWLVFRLTTIDTSILDKIRV